MSVMKTLTLLVALIAPWSVAAQQVGDTATIHVSASHWTTLPADRSTTSFEILTAVINGRHVELSGGLGGPDMLLPGDYRARLVSGDRTRTFDLIGVRE
jgi:hypothetical protein